MCITAFAAPQRWLSCMSCMRNFARFSLSFWQTPMDIQTIDAQFSTCPQITPQDLAEIASLGFKTVVNFRPDGEGGDSQPLNASLAAEAAALGLQYAYIPTIPNQIQDTQVQALAMVLAKQPGPILGFCRTGNRAGNVYQRSLQAGKPACCGGDKAQDAASSGVLASITSLFKNK